MSFSTLPECLQIVLMIVIPRILSCWMSFINYQDIPAVICLVVGLAIGYIFTKEVICDKSQDTFSERRKFEIEKEATRSIYDWERLEPDPLKRERCRKEAIDKSERLSELSVTHKEFPMKRITVVFCIICLTYSTVNLVIGTSWSTRNIPNDWNNVSNPLTGQTDMGQDSFEVFTYVVSYTLWLSFYRWLVNYHTCASLFDASVQPAVQSMMSRATKTNHL